MRRLLQWTGIALGVLVGLLVLAYAILYVRSERVMQRAYDIPQVSISIPTDSESIAEGKRLAIVRGCLNGCHGKDAQGAVMFDDWKVARVVAPNLTAAVRNYTDAELVNIIRNGVRPNGRSMVIMPAEVFVDLSDADLGRIIAFLKSLPSAPGPSPEVSLGPGGRAGLGIGKFNTAAGLITERVPPPEAPNKQAAYGRYLARTVCTGCHGTDLRGTSAPDPSPGLQVVAAYSPEAFAELMRTGAPLGGRKLGMMREVARDNLSALTDVEIAALYTYLHALPPP
jgi:cytochrome c553